MRRKERESLFEKGRLFDIVALRVRTYSEMALIRGSRPYSLINNVCQRHLRASLCKILISSFAHKMDFAHNFSVEVYNKYETRLEKFASVNFLTAPHEDLRCL